MDQKRFEEEAVVSVALGRAVQPTQFPHHSFCARWAALCCAVALTRAFDRGGAHQAEQQLAKIPVRASALSSYAPDVRVHQARIEAARLRGWATLLLGDRLCFASSFAVCGGLRRLGYSCCVEVGYECIHQYTETPLHAYVVCEGEIVNDDPEIQYGFIPLLAYGKKEGKWQ